MRRLGATQQKIILMLAGGAALGFSRTPRQYFRTFRKLQKEWSRVNQGNFDRSIRRLAQEKMLEEKILSDGSFKLVLTKKGRARAKKLSLLGDSIKFKKPGKWDGRWRIVFDIPEEDRIFRAILREHLYTLDFYKMQNSVFVSPHPCEKSILDLVDLYEAGRHVRVITAAKIDNEKFLKKHFSI